LVAADAAPARLTPSSLLQNPQGRSSRFDGDRQIYVDNNLYPCEAGGSTTMRRWIYVGAVDGSSSTSSDGGRRIRGWARSGGGGGGLVVLVVGGGGGGRFWWWWWWAVVAVAGSGNGGGGLCWRRRAAAAVVVVVLVVVVGDGGGARAAGRWPRCLGFSFFCFMKVQTYMHARIKFHAYSEI
jgi:hypothetical protein